MNTQPQNTPNSDLPLKVAHAVLSEASRRPWLATLLLHRKQWLIELTQRLSNLSRQTRRLFRRALAAGFSAIAILAATFLWTSPARAGTITVDGSTCTLANAITTANTGTNTGGCTGGSGGADTIDLQTNVTLTAALPQITTDITIEGNGHTIQRDGGASKFRILHVSGSGNLTLKKATITGGATEGVSDTDGGGIFIESGSATIIDSSITGNYAIGPGGGIRSNTNLTIENSTIGSNTAPSWGGGIYATGTSLTIKNSTISGNSATSTGDGGAICSFGIDSLTIENSTITGNSAPSTGIGGLYLYSPGHAVFVKNSIIAFQSSGADCYIGYDTTMTSQGYNIESSNTCNFTGAGDQRNVSSGSLNLSALADNGGPTQTHALGSGSVAIDQIPNGTNGCTAGTSVDQRGAARANGVNMGGSTCDVGAYEANSTQTPTAVKVRAFAASTRSPAGIIAAFMAEVTAGGAGWLGWRRRQT